MLLYENITNVCFAQKSDVEAMASVTDISNKHVTSPDCMLLLCIWNRKSNIEGCDIIFQKLNWPGVY